MLRATKFLLAFFVLALTLANCEQLSAVEYEVGPFQLVGQGEDAGEAEDSAWSQAWNIITLVDENVPQGHQIVDILVDFEALITPNAYFVQFSILLEIEI